MSVDALSMIGEKDFARRSLWEATLFDKNGTPLKWTSGLIKSTPLPKISFTVSDIYAGASKAYTDWKLPDTIPLSMWETSDHSVEKYLDEWMIGKDGILDTQTGQFRVFNDERYLYRDLQVRTFIYDITSKKNLSIKAKSISRDFTFEVKTKTQQIKNIISQQSGTLSIQDREHIKEAGLDMLKAIELQKAQTHAFIKKKQIIPVLDKLLSVASGAVNQITGKLPSSNITRRIIPAVIIPPPLMKVPVMTATPIPLADTEIPHFIFPHDSIAQEDKKRQLQLLTDIDHYLDEYSTLMKIEEIKEENSNINLGSVQWEAKEKTTSLITYTTAISSYDIGTYDYVSGEGVSYNINLSVKDIKVEHPV